MTKLRKKVIAFVVDNDEGWPVSRNHCQGRNSAKKSLPLLSTMMKAGLSAEITVNDETP